MIIKKIWLLACIATLPLGSYAQKSTLEWDDILQWRRITSKSISNDGEHIVVTAKPWKGDGATSIYRNNGEMVGEFECAESPRFISDNVVIATITPAKQLVDSLTLKKTKKENMPMKQLLIYNLSTLQSNIVDSLQEVKWSDKNRGWAAYRTEKSKQLTLTNFDDVQSTFDHVTAYNFSKKRGYAILNRYKEGEFSQILIYHLDKKEVAAQFEIESGMKCNQLTVNELGQAAYITAGEDLSGKENQIHYWDGQRSTPIEVTDLPNDWVINETLAPYFAESAPRLFFGVSPQYPVNDTTLLESEKPGVDVWVWNEPKLKTQQVIDYDKDIKRPYTAMFNTQTKEAIQIANLETPLARVLEDGDSPLALLEATEPYEMESMWTGQSRRDLYLKNLVTGENSEIAKGIDARISISPASKYLYWYLAQDSSWNVYSTLEQRIIKLTTPSQVKAYDQNNSVPDLPQSYGSAGWGKEDNTLYIYDKYDLWAVDPTGNKEPQRITNGAESATTYRVLRLDPEQKYFDNSEKLLLRLFDNRTKESGYATMKLGKKGSLKELVKGKYLYGMPLKAQESDEIVFTRENFQEFPDLYLCDTEFKQTERPITHLNPQQEQFNWGTVEPIRWVSLDGDTLQGNLYKPENFDPNKKYPMICNFYEEDSDGLYNHKVPEVHRSTIDYHYYTSNGYVIFNPDIKYTDGYPGESCYNSLMPGITKILEMGFVDANRIGAQGHSWGGYQVAYLATRTNMFAAIESGAPVVNMISAYGGIRWASGLNRAFQYEHGQSRIGYSPWETPARYTENSPIYTMDKVETPILIMHNDKDGHVPWWQGIEFFVALRRLEKPAWLLNYRGEPHWPQKPANMLDFQTKMGQFFDHYLKGTDMPKWMMK